MHDHIYRKAGAGVGLLAAAVLVGGLPGTVSAQVYEDFDNFVSPLEDNEGWRQTPEAATSWPVSSDFGFNGQGPRIASQSAYLRELTGEEVLSGSSVFAETKMMPVPGPNAEHRFALPHFFVVGFSEQGETGVGVRFSGGGGDRQPEGQPVGSINATTGDGFTWGLATVSTSFYPGLVGVQWMRDTWYTIQLQDVGVNNTARLFVFETENPSVVLVNGLTINMYGVPFSQIDTVMVRDSSASPRNTYYDEISVDLMPASWTADAGGNWSASGNWSQPVPNAAGANAMFGREAISNQTVTVDEAVTLRSIRFHNVENSYTLDGPGGITLDALELLPDEGDARLVPAQVIVDAGSHTISTALNLASHTSFNVNPTASTLTVSNLNAAGVDIQKNGRGVLEVNNVTSSSLAIQGGTVWLEPGSGQSTVGALSVADNARLDLTDNSVVVQNGDLATLHALVKSGYAAGEWNGPGINSTAAAAATDRAVGIGPNGDDVLIRFTFAGDATLDGVVNISDLSILAANWQDTNRLWHQGDFNFDGIVNISDLSILAANWQKGIAGGPAMSFEEAMAMFDVFGGVEVPEPASLGLLAMAGLLALRRRRA